MAPISEQDERPWNRIYIDDVIDAINPHICIRCLQRKDKPGVNTICAACQTHLDAPSDAAEHSLFFTCLRIFDFWLWLRRKSLSDQFVLRNRERRVAVEHYIGMPGHKRNLPSLNGGGRLVGGDGGDGSFEFWSPMERELLKQVMLTSRQCDRVMVLLADIMKQELLQGMWRQVLLPLIPSDKLSANSPVLKLDEILFNANHEYTSTHWCYCATLRDGRQFAIAFSDRQLGWLHLVRDWKEYVLDRFHEVDEAEALFYMKNPDGPDANEITEDAKAVKSCWKERGVSVRKLGGVQAAHVSRYYPQSHWSTEAKQIWSDELPPYDVFTENMPEDWEPEHGLTDAQVERRQKRFECHLVRDDGGVGTLWKLWEEELEGVEEMKEKCKRKSESKLASNGKDVATPEEGAEGKKRKLGKR